MVQWLKLTEIQVRHNMTDWLYHKGITNWLLQREAGVKKEIQMLLLDGHPLQIVSTVMADCL